MTEQLNSVNVQEYDRKDLKIQHYKEKVSQLEDALANARVELTLVSQELDKANEELAKYDAAVPQPLGEDELQEETGN